MNQKKENKILDILAKVRWILPVVLYCFLVFCSYPFLQKVEERSFFQFDSFWFYSFLDRPSGFISWCSLFLTQFLHLPWMGALIWVILITIAAESTRVVFSIPKSLFAIAYIPVSILVTYNMSLGYLVYYMNLPGYFFIPILGYLLVLFTVLVSRKIKKAVPYLIFALTYGLAGYYLAGSYALAGIIVSGIDIACSDRSRSERCFSLISDIAIVIIAPIMFSGLTTYNLAEGWTIGMPHQITDIPVLRLQFPIIIALLLTALMPLLRFKNLHLSLKALSVIQGMALAATIALPTSLWFRDDNFKAELNMIHAVDNLEWDKTIKLFEDLSSKHEKDPSWQPTRVLVLLKDLALIKTGQEGERAFCYDDGSKPQKTKWLVPMAFQIGRILHLHYGIPGLSNRWCIEEAVMFGWNNMTYKYMFMNSLLLGNIQAARNYLSAMEHTLFYRKWAKDQQRLCNDSEKNLLAHTAPYDMILPLMCYEDEICSDQMGCENFLNYHFNSLRPENATPLYDRIALFYALKSKQTTLFWTRYLLYLDSNNPQKIARFYQEATYLYGNITNDKTLLELPLDDNIKNLYKSFSQTAQKTGNRSLEESRLLFPANQRHTFYYYYFYVNGLQLF